MVYKERTTVRELRYNINAAFQEVYFNDKLEANIKLHDHIPEYVLVDAELSRIRNTDAHLSNINSVGLRNMFIKFLKKKGYVKTKRSPLTYTYIPPEVSTQIINGKKYEVTMQRIT